MEIILAQCIKELAQFRRDRLAAALVFLLPIMTMLIFGLAIRLEIKDVPLAITDFDNSPLSRAYIEQVFATNQFKPIATTNDAMELLDRGIAQALIIIPPNFSRQLQQQKINATQVLIDGTDVNNARVIQNSLRATTEFFLEKQGFQTQDPEVLPRTRIGFNPGRKESLFIVPGVYAVVLFTYPALVAAMAVVREKEEGTLVQFKASGMSAWEFLMGKTLAYVLIAISETILLMGLGAILFNLWPVGNPLPLIIGTILFLLVSVVYGLLIGVYSQQALAAVQAVMNTGLLAAVWLSGFIYPVENIPWPLSILADIVAARYYIELTRDAFIVGAGWPRIGHVMPILFVMTLVMFVISWWKLNRE